MLICLVVGAALRIAYALRCGLWRDEALFLFITRSPGWAEMFDFLQGSESHPPLFYVFYRLWESLAGRSDAAVLAPPVAIGLLLVPAGYGVAQQVFGRPTALLAAMLFAVSPILAEHAALVRPYSLLPLLALVAAFALWRALLTGRWQAWTLYVAVMEAMLWTHHWAWMVLGGQWVALVGWVVLHPTRPRGRLFKEMTLAQMALLMGYSPWLPTFLFQAQHAGHAPKAAESLWVPFNLVVRCVTSIPDRSIAGTILALAALGVALKMRAMVDDEAGEAHRLALGLFAVSPLVSIGLAAALSFKSDLLQPRTVLIVAPCLQLVLIDALASLLSRLRPWLAGAVALGVVGSYGTLAVAMLDHIKSNAREIAQQVEAQVRPSDLIVISPEWMASGFNYYFRPDNPQINYPAEGRHGATSFVDVAERLAAPEALVRVKDRLGTARQEGHRVWLVMESDTLDRHVDEAEAPSLRRQPWPIIGTVRTRQLYEHLVRLYGPPAHEAHSPMSRASGETLVAFLFEQGG